MPNELCSTCGLEKCAFWNEAREHGSCAWPGVCHGGHPDDSGKVCRCEEKNLNQSVCKGFPSCSTPKSEEKCEIDPNHRAHIFPCSKFHPTPSDKNGEVKITEEMLKDVAREANLDQLALVLFHECRHQPESGKGIARIREALQHQRILGRREQAKACGCEKCLLE